MFSSEIEKLSAREILDSRGNPTVEVDVELTDGSFGRAAVPSGASTGKFEAHELRDNDKKRFHGKGVTIAIDAIHGEISDLLCGLDATNQVFIDYALNELDGTENKSRLGANATLGVSLAVAKAAANSVNMPLYRYIGGCNASTFPTPLINVINGGAHANNNLAFQEFMIAPTSCGDFRESIRTSSEVFHTLKKLIDEKGLSTSVGDEGGFAPNLKSNEEALELLLRAIEKAGYKVGDDFSLALDAAASEFYSKGKYSPRDGEMPVDSDELIDYYAELVKNFPITSIEDGMAEEDWDGWVKLTKKLGQHCLLIGDDLFATNVTRLGKGLELGAANSILIKLNQIGTLSEAMDVMEIGYRHGFNCVISHRSGETEDTFIADFCIGTNCSLIKTGSLSRSERLAKYNQIMRIQDEFVAYKANLPGAKD